MDATELARRRLVWEALSELFLDTETRWYLSQVALALVRSRYTADELERILRTRWPPNATGIFSSWPESGRSYPSTRPPW